MPNWKEELACWQRSEEQKTAARAVFDAKVRRYGYVDRVTGERVYDPARLVPEKLNSKEEPGVPRSC